MDQFLYLIQFMSVVLVLTLISAGIHWLVATYRWHQWRKHVRELARGRETAPTQRHHAKVYPAER